MHGTLSSRLNLDGSVLSGLGRGAQFLALEWVRLELRLKLALECFPGTLNLRISEQVWSELYARRNSFLKIADPSSASCPGFLKGVTLRAHGRVYSPAYLILPELTMYKDVLEIIAADHLRQKLGLQDGDVVRVEEWEPSRHAE